METSSDSNSENICETVDRVKCHACLGALWPHFFPLAPKLGETRPGDAPPPALTGRAFCFLPLPISTGLPAHVNGCFALTSNRRELWREDADQQLLGLLCLSG